MSGTLQATILKDGASSTNNLTFDSSGNATVGNNLTVTGNTSVTGTITGSSTIAAATGTLYPIVSGTAQASTSGTSITFSSIPSWVKRVTVMFNAVSTNGTSLVQVQIGSGGVTSTGYTSGSNFYGPISSGSSYTSTTGFLVDSGGGNAAWVRYGQLILTLQNPSSNTWVSSSNIYTNSSGSSYIFGSGGVVALSGALDRVVITTANGTDTFDAGSINIFYE